MATEIEPLIMPFDPLWVTTSKGEYREAVRRMGEEPGDTKGKDGLTSCIPGKGCVIWISRKVKAPDLYALAAHEATHAACDMLASIGGAPMKYVSLFSGIEAATTAWEPLGWEPACFAEFDEFPSAVLAERYPEVPNIGDVTKMNWKKYRGKVDLVVGGSPCQSFSIAGKREGLQGESGLMFEYIRAVREIRPRWFLWENVPGALSSENGEAFRQLLSEMDKLGYGLAWRVLDAQFFGVAQRRRRLFLVGHLGACPPRRRTH